MTKIIFDVPKEYYGNRLVIGKLSEWDINDSEEKFKKNLRHPRTRQILEDLNWIDRKIIYNYNEYGFRCNNFKKQHTPNVMFLGGSTTAAIGLPIESSYTYKIAKRLGLAHYNLAIAGGSVGSMFRIANFWIPLLKPSIVIGLCPPADRFEILDSKGVPKILLPSFLYDQKRFYREWISNEYNTKLDVEKNKLAIKQLCVQNNIKCIMLEEMSDFQWTDFEVVDLARDLEHTGEVSHTNTAEYILKLIEDIN